MINLALIGAGFSIGMAGSLHCIGMCGPIAMSLPVQSFSAGKKIIGAGLYNMGRLFSYTALGALTGMIGRQFFIGGYQQLFSVLAGLLLITGVVVIQKKNKSKKSSLFMRTIQGLIVRYMHNPSLVKIFFIGVGNGLLPCGMVYVAMIAAATTGTALSASIFMISFGAGTIPLMWLVSFAGIYLHPSFRIFWKKASPYVTVCIGILLVLRGLDLGIPYISPVVSRVFSGNAISCH